MKIIRQTARDMRQALRAVREQLGEDAVILSSRRTGDGVEVTAAVDFDASTLEAGGFAEAPAAAPPPVIDVTPVAVSSRGGNAPAPTRSAAPASFAPVAGTTRQAAHTDSSSARGRAGSSSAARGARSSVLEHSGSGAELSHARSSATSGAALATANGSAPSARSAALASAPSATSAAGRSNVATNPTVLALTMRRAQKTKGAEQAAKLQHVETHAPAFEPAPQPAPSYDELAATQRQHVPNYNAGYDADWISEAAREAVAEHLASPRAPVLAPAPESRAEQTAYAGASYEEIAAAADPVEEIREATLTPLASNEIKATFAEFRAAPAAAPAATEAMGNELKTLRRMLETQLAQLAWNDLTRRAPVHTEMLRELTEIGITQDLAEHLVRQLPEDTDLTFARRFTIAGISQYLKVTGDHWLDDGGRVAFAGATGVGKTTTLAKIAVRWVLRHGPRDIALVAADSARIGAQDQLKSLAQLLGVPVYTPEKFDHLPTLLSHLSERLVLIDTPGSSVRDPQLASRLAVLSNSASKLETALVLAASTQAGAIEEAVKHFAPANPSCCVLTKLDEAASLGGVLSILIRARMPVSYMSEGQRVPEDLRPARALELVSAAVRLAKARGAAADEDLLRRRFGKTAHGIS